RVDDSPRAFKLEGKQGYGNARGIWQTTYLEARPQNFLETIHFTPDIDRTSVKITGRLNAPASNGTELKLEFKSVGLPPMSRPISDRATEFQFEVPVPNLHLWSLDDPFLYEVDASLRTAGTEDRVATYFGMRKISVVNLPGLGFPYIALNNKPIY